MHYYLIGLCLLLIFCLIGCHKNEDQFFDEILPGTWKFVNENSNYLITHFQIEGDKLIISYDRDQDGRIDKVGQHQFYVCKRNRAKYFQLKAEGDSCFHQWYRYEIDGNILKLFLGKEIAEFVFVPTN